jgi:hypothetical protein
MQSTLAASLHMYLSTLVYLDVYKAASCWEGTGVRLQILPLRTNWHTFGQRWLKRLPIKSRYVPKLLRWAQLEIARSPGQEQISYLFKVLHRTKRELGLKCHFSLRFEKKLNEQSNVPVCQIKFAVELVSEIYPKLSPSTICSTSLHTGLV